MRSIQMSAILRMIALATSSLCAPLGWADEAPPPAGGNAPQGTGAVTGAAPTGAAPAPAPTGAAPAKADPKGVELAIYKTIMGSAPQIDACTEAYTNEFPSESGQARIVTTVVKDGSVGKVQVSAPMGGVRNLLPCLEKVAKGWRFPKLAASTESVQMSLAVVVKKGAKFAIPKPGEKQETPPEEKKEGQDDSFVQFTPTGWGG